MEISFKPLFEGIKKEWSKVMDKGVQNYFSNDLSKDTRQEALLNLINNKSDFEFYERKIEDGRQLGRAHLIIGVYSDMDTQIEISTEDVIISTLKLEKNSPQFIIGNKSILPSICLYSTIRLNQYDEGANIKIIYAEVDFKLIQSLAETRWKITNEKNESFYILKGIITDMCCQEYNYYDVPDMLFGK